jgi:TRAP-type uncharacterized transport system fused permease subunit
VELGVPDLYAHLFVFWYALLCTITPPVCGNVFIAAGLAQTAWLPVAWRAMQLGIGLFILPLGFIANPSMLTISAAPLLALAIYLVLRRYGLHAVPYHQEVLLGWGLGLPLLHGLSRRRGGRLDQLAGDISYGVFLNHFLLLWALLKITDASAVTGVSLGVLIIASVVLGWLTQRLVERPALAWRRRLRLS